MPGPLHESFVSVLRRRECALQLARILGVPHHPAELWHDVDAEFSDPNGKGRVYHADLALVAFQDANRGGEALAGLIFEPQLAVDPGKAISWPIYWVGLRTRHACKVWTLVISPIRHVVRWAADELFAGEAGFPHVIGREQVEPVLDLETALANPAWAAFTAALHARGPHADAAATILVQACASLPAEDRRCYLRLLYAGMKKPTMNAISPSIPEAIKVELTEYEREGGWFQNGLEEGQALGEARGRVEGEAKALLRLIERRGLALTPEQRSRVESCEDASQIERWLDRVLDVDTADALLAD